MRLLLLLTVLICCFSCKKYEDLEVSSTEPEYAIPIGHAELSLADIIEGLDDSTALQIDPDGLLHLNYKGTVQRFQGSDIAEFINQFNAPISLIDTFMPLPFTAPNGIDVDFAVLSAGSAIFAYRTPNINEPYHIKITIDNIITDNGEPYVFYNEHDGPVDFNSEVLSFAGDTLRPTNDSIFIHYECILKSNGQFVEPDFIGVSIFDFEASYVEGFLGQETFNVDRDTIEIDFFKETLTGDVFIEDPKVNVVINNSFGFPIRSNGTIFNFFQNDGTILPLESSALDLINVDYPTLDEVGVIKQTVFPFDNDNSNLSELILSRPVELEYEFKADANPDLDTTIRGFLLDTSVFEIQVSVDLPLRGWVKNFNAKDTANLSLDPVDQEIESAELKIIVDNEIPMDIQMQGIFLDENNNQLDSLFDAPKTIIRRDLNASTPTKEIIFLPLSRDKMDRITNANRIALSGIINTSGLPEEIVQIVNTQKVDVKIGLKIKLKP